MATTDQSTQPMHRAVCEPHLHKLDYNRARPWRGRGPMSFQFQAISTIVSELWNIQRLWDSPSSLHFGQPAREPEVLRQETPLVAVGLGCALDSLRQRLVHWSQANQAGLSKGAQPPEAKSSPFTSVGQYYTGHIFLHCTGGQPHKPQSYLRWS